MQFKSNGHLFVPESPPTPLCIYIDETNLHHQTGLIQSAVILPENIYETKVVPDCRLLLRQLGPKAKEFHASRIASKTSVCIYSKFLQYFVDAVSIASDTSTIRSIITVDSYSQYSNDNFNTINDSVRAALDSLHLVNLGTIEEEISRQLVWLFHHVNKILPFKYSNHLKIIFDEKGDFAKQCRNLKAIQINGQLPSLLEVNRILKTTFNAFFSVHSNHFNISNIDQVTFLESERSFGLQAADIFSNMMYGALRYAKGINISATSLRQQILNTVMPSLKFETTLLDSLTVSGNNIECSNNDLISTFTLEPT